MKSIAQIFLKTISVVALLLMAAGCDEVSTEKSSSAIQGAVAGKAAAEYCKAANLHELRLAFETTNMIVSAEMKLRASLMRKESRCSHYRLDYPEMDTKSWNAWINIYKGSDGSMKLEKQPFDNWPT